MNIQTAFSTQPAAAAAAAEIKAQLQGLAPKLVIYFASSTYAPEAIAREMQAAFGATPVFGCTTAGEIITGRMLKNSVVAMGLNANVLRDVKIEVLENIRQDAQAVPQALTNFEKHFNKPLLEMDHTRYVGLILIDGLSGMEEQVMERIGDQTNVQFIGASAGDDVQFKCTYVFANGRAYTSAAVLALLEPATGFDFIKTQSFCASQKTLVPTRVNRERREVLEFNHRPAVEAYAEAVGAPPAQLAEHFMSQPVGLMLGAEPYVRSPQQVQGQSVIFYCAVSEDMELKVLEATDIIADTRRALADKIAQSGPIQGLINFHCILRTLELESKGLMEAYGQLFAEIPTIGFSTYGEEFIGHINQTSTMLIFK